ncbi:hypothetical protein D8B26_005985 [Coccidioides posadasii str. Silveira]|uniref:Nucleoporin NUP188 n=1 Tax=Coccidioides posadasii (strain RMSCC 757 / Silveira) TaxID=443226 RepID=E9DI33_COCPS|nr:nucleoporin Nup184 [Coccidioides posadasii str. Silveira]QVM11333.1 hypothetical protein D8B26_005985 [Coccidioides posadasii str. Silveira]
MAPPPEVYFPSLDDCLSGDAQLIPWESAFLGLTSSDDNITGCDSLFSFLTTPESVRILSNPFDPYPKPSDTTKSAFQSKTAAINVTPALRARCNFNDIEGDALWLSKKTLIDEVSALRLAVQEWQSRPELDLLNQFSEEEVASLQSVVSVGQLSHQAGGTQALEFLKGPIRKGQATESLSEDERRLKLFRLYLVEKQNIIKVALYVLSVSLHGRLPGTYRRFQGGAGDRSSQQCTKLDELGASIFPRQNDGSLDKPGLTIQACIEAIQSCLSKMNGGSDWLSPEAEYAQQLSIIEDVVQIMQILFLQLQESENIPSAEVLLSWLHLIVTYDFFDQNRPLSQEESTLFDSLKSLTSIITLSFLKLRTATTLFEAAAAIPSRTIPDVWGDTRPSFLSCEHISEINEIFLKAADAEKSGASPAMFAWGMIMFTLREIALATREDRELQQAQYAVDAFNGGTSSILAPRNADPSVYEEAYERARNPAFEDDFVKFMISIAVDRCRVFDVASSIIRQLDGISGSVNGSLITRWARVEMLDLVRVSVEYLSYIPELLSTVLQVMAWPNSAWHCVGDSPTENDGGVKGIFLCDEILMSKLFKIAKSRFPYEAINFLKLCRSLLDCNLSTDDGYPLIFQELEYMEAYTQRVSPGFHGYQSTREDENANYVSLIEPLEMKELSSARKDYAAQSGSELMVMSGASILPAETLGQVVNESKPAVIMWHYRYNCLCFLGMWLEQATYSRKTDSEPEEDIISEIIGLLADLVASAQGLAKQQGVESAAKRILEMASDGLNHHGDIISVVFDIFERNLQSATTKMGTERGLETTTACLSFLNSLVTVIPGRVWPFLTRSSFIAGDGNGGTLPAIVSAIEVNTGDFSFLLEAARTFKLIVDDVVRHVAVRKIAGSVTAKATHVTEYTAGAPSYVMSNLLQSFVRIMVDVYNSSYSWRFNDASQSLRLNISLTEAFHDILHYTYGVDDEKDLDSKLTGVFANSARYLLKMLRPSSKDGIFFNPVLRIILNGYHNPLLDRSAYLRYLQTRLVDAALNLSSTLIQSEWNPQSPMTGLEKQLFDASPVLIRLYVFSQAYQLPVVKLLELLLAHASMDKEQEPPSLLGHLGAESSCRFLDVLSKFDQPFDDTILNAAIWKFLTTVISKRQQWLAVFLLTGSSPRDALKEVDGEKPAMQSKPFLQAALDLISLIGSIPSQLVLSALEFIAKAQENWPWATPQLKNHADFFPKMVNYVSNLDMRRYSPYEQCMNTRIASLIADICAVYLHSAKEQRDWTFFKTLIPLISWYSENAVEVNGYNTSLHVNLKRNFEMKYPGCSLFAIKRTSLDNPVFGENYFYDIASGTKIFGYEFAWTGSRNQGFVDEIKRANENLSLVQAQMDLLHSFKFLAIEHCADFMPDRGVQKSMASVVRHCLTANSQSVPNENIFCKLHQIRAEFALGLLQRLVEVQAKGSEVFALLQTVWDATRFRNQTYEAALANDDTEYYGMLLNILFLALQFHVGGKSRLVPEAVSKKPEVSGHLEIVLDIVRVIAARGFRSLTTYLHDAPQKCSPKDFALLTAILQTALKVKSVDRIYEQFAFHLADADTIRYACTLFSWSYKLTVEGDPIYGELSILYLLELSCIPMMAEQIAVDGVLVKLSTYRLTDVLRQPQGCGPFDQVPRLFTIWHNGFLPLCLNLLYHVGRAAPEVAAFLNQFEGQLRRASEAFSIGHPSVTSPFGSPGPRSLLSSGQSIKRLSLGMATEACSLALISLIIEKFRDAGPSAGVDSQNMQELKWDRNRVKEDIEVLLEKKSILRSRIAPTNEKEVAWAQRIASDSDGGAESLLEEKIVKELQTVLSCIGGSD